MQNQQNNYQYSASSNNGQYYQQQPQPVQGTNALAISSLVCGIIGWIIPILFALLAIIFGHVARSQIKRSGQGGAGIALTGLIMGYIQIAVMGLFIAAAIVLPAYQDYVIRSKIKQAVELLYPVRSELERQIAADPANAAHTAVATATLSAPELAAYWQDVRVENSVIYARFNNNAALTDTLRGNTLILTPQADGSRIGWQCAYARPVSGRYLPPELCR